MKIKNARLREYINNNTTSTIRDRGDKVRIIDCEISSDYDSAKASVRGRGRNKYELHFYGLQSGMVSSSCTCPFDWGNVCKHVVAVANEIDLYLEHIGDETIQLAEKIEKKTYSKTSPIKIPFVDIDDITDAFLKKYASTSAYRESFYGSDYILDIDTKPNCASFSITNKYSYTGNNVQVRKKENTLSLSCDCKATNKALCVHQVKILNYIAEEMSQIFISEKELDKIKEEKLREYGFSLKDNSYKEYFSFEFNTDGVEIINKKAGMVKLDEKDGLNIMLNTLVSDEEVKKYELPYAPLPEKKTKAKGIAIGFIFHEYQNYSPPVILTPLRGNLKKDGTSFVSKIEEIEAEDLILKKYSLKEEEVNLLSCALKLSEHSLYDLRNEDEFVIEKYEHTVLKELIPKLENQLIYEMDYYEQSKQITKRQLTPIKLSIKSTELSFKIVEEVHHHILKAYITINEKKSLLSKKEIGGNFLFVEDKDTYYLNKSINYAKTLIFFDSNPEIRIPKEGFDAYYSKFIKPLSEKYEIETTHLKYKTKTPEINEFKKQLYLSEHDGFILFKPVLEYNEQHIGVLSKKMPEEIKNGTLFRVKRDADYEKEFLDTIRTLHQDFYKQDQSFFYLFMEDFIKGAWFIDAFEVLKENDIEIFGFDTLSNIKYNRNKANISVNVNSETDWFDVNIQIAFGDLTVSLKDVSKSIVNKSNYIELKDGTIGILPKEWIEKYKHLFRTGDVKKDSITISKYQLSAIDSLYDELDQDSDMIKNHREMKKKLQSFKEIDKITEPRGVKAKLRDYQKEGLNWLNFLDEYNFGGCLADDMGLGKTLQIITFFKYLKDKKKTTNAHLIVVPTSLIFNWQEEIKKFCPTLKIFALIGGDRKKDTDIFKKTDLVLTTYGIVMRDIDYLKEYNFDYIVLDESQAIKNPNSQRFKAVRLLQSKNKIVLTGTPIENNTFDLYSQMTFVNPGLLGSMANFKKEFSTPIDKNRDTEVAKELKELINPFLLRRTKEQVATELPEKTEQILFCTMDTEQQQLYDAYRNKYRDYLLNKIDETGLGKSKMYVLEGLTKLRQICDSPQLLKEDEKYTDESIKIKELIRHITEKTGNHKILVFSQFVKMLGLIKNKLDKENIKYEYLDGKTKNRQEKVENFQGDENVRVFLISLKAGGTGLNLTAADYVYLVDPWWNPAVEAQAIDRCYRIGQSKHVMAYKMICKGTIEEKIVQHQSNKKQLSDDIIQTEESFVKSLSKESIEELFS